MNLQNLFYLFAIIFMSLGIVVLIIISYVLFVIKNRIVHLHDLVDRKVDQLTKFTNDPADAAMTIGAKMANTAVKKVRQALSK